MAKQTINIGSGELTGDGESLRSAFDKINDNFDELYLKDTSDFDGQFSSLAGTPTTLAGYGITDAATASQGALAATAVQPQTSLSGYGITDAYTKAEVDSEISTATSSLSLQSGSTHSIDIVAADSTVLVDSVNGTLNATTLTGALPAIDGSSLTGITTAFSNITSTPTTIAGYGITDAFDGAFGSLSGTPTTLAGYGITDAVTAGGDFEGNLSGSVFADDSTVLVDGVNGTLNSSALTKPIALADNEKITFGDGDDLEIHHTGGVNYIAGAGGTIITGNWLYLRKPGSAENYLIGKADGAVEVYYDNVKKLETTADGVAVTGKITGLTDPTDAQDAATKAYVDANSGGGGSGLQSRSTATATTSSIPDGTQVDLDITGFKSYALLSITTDRAARVRLYVTSATRSADASRAEGVDPTSDAGLIAEVITTGAETVIISPGAFGFNLEGTPTSVIPCRVTNKSGGASTVQVDLNILQLEA